MENGLSELGNGTRSLQRPLEVKRSRHRPPDSPPRICLWALLRDEVGDPAPSLYFPALLMLNRMGMSLSNYGILER